MSVDTFITSHLITNPHGEESEYNEQAEVPECDLVTFLAVTQKLQVDIFPITWNSARELIGFGLTATVHEALINSQTSFAFKRTRQHKLNRARGLQALINELAVLSQLREHPNTVELHGICWDVRAYDVWPVLVFEKAQFGDLSNFLKLLVGRDLFLPERLSLCVDIGTAIIYMHSNGMKIRW